MNIIFECKIKRSTFIDRIQNQEELIKLVNLCFKENEFLTKEAFRKIIFEKSSDMFIALFSYIRKTIPIQSQLEFISKYSKGNSSISLSTNSPEISTPKILFKTNIIKNIIMNSPQNAKSALPICNSFEENIFNFEKVKAFNNQEEWNSLKNKIGIMKNIALIKTNPTNEKDSPKLNISEIKLYIQKIFGNNNEKDIYIFKE